MAITFGDRPFHNLFVPTALPFREGSFDVDELALRRFLEYIAS
jgi:hypothetical protein